jgi:hypothetical protein
VRAAWIEAGRQAVDTGTVNVECPENADAMLQAQWIPRSAGDGKEGEYRVWCPGCGAQNFVLVRDRKSP